MSRLNDARKNARDAAKEISKIRNELIHETYLPKSKGETKDEQKEGRRISKLLNDADVHLLAAFTILRKVERRVI